MMTMDWFFDWLPEHQAKVRHPHWVDPEDTAYYLAWVEFFEKEKISESEAYALTKRMQVTPPRYPDRTLEAILAILPAMREELSGGNPVSGSRDEAISRSLGCRECGGVGFSVRYVHPEDGPKLSLSSGARIPHGMPVSSPCGSCELGQHIARSVAGPGRQAHTWRDVPDFAVGPVEWSSLPDNRHRYKPSQWDFETDRPSIPPLGLETVGGKAVDPKRLAGSLASRKRHQGEFVPPPPRSLARDDARAVPARSDAGDSLPDPVLERERARQDRSKLSQSGDIPIPEDDLNSF
jgi:hypothetical protein